MVVNNSAKVGRDSISGALSDGKCSLTEVTDRPAMAATPWCAIQTRYRFERKVTAQLQRQGFETFLPVLKEIHRWSDRRKAVDTLLFPGYTFARLDFSPLPRREMLKIGGIVGVVEFSGTAAQVPARQIEDLRKLLSQDVPCALHPFLRAGQKVRIRDGCLDGLEGILEEAGQKSLVISIDSIERSIAITIEGYELELI